MFFYNKTHNHTMIQPLTRKQREIYDFYDSYIRENKRVPSYSEAGEILNLDRTVVYTHIKNLEKKWYLIATNGDIKINIEEQAKVPLLGYVACWSPISVNEEILWYVDIPKSTISYWSSFYALKAKWESMKNAGIHDSDILIIRQQSDVNDGDIAVVILWEYEDDERATLKRVYHSPKALILKPENDDFPTQIITWPSEVRGKLISVIRNY